MQLKYRLTPKYLTTNEWFQHKMQLNRMKKSKYCYGRISLNIIRVDVTFSFSVSGLNVPFS